MAKSPVTFPEDLSSAPSTQTGKLTTTCTSSSIGSDTVLGPTDAISSAATHICTHTHIDKDEIKHNLKCSISHVNCKLKLSQATAIYADNVGAMRETPSHCWRGRKVAQVLQNTVDQFHAAKPPSIQQPHYLVPTQMALRFISMCKFALGVYGHTSPPHR